MATSAASTCARGAWTSLRSEEPRRRSPGDAAAALGAAGLQHFAPSDDRHRVKPPPPHPLLSGSPVCPREIPRSAGPKLPATDSSDERSLLFLISRPKHGAEMEKDCTHHPDECGDMCDAGACNACSRNKSLSQNKYSHLQKQGLKQSANPFYPPKIFAAACQLTPFLPPQRMNEM